MEDPIRVLHVDDEPEFAELTKTYLERLDDRFVVKTLPAVSDGLDWLADTAVDCIVSDYDMPGMDGIAFLKAVRADWPELPFILFTGKGSEEVASAAISAGVTDYVQKRGGSDGFETSGKVNSSPAVAAGTLYAGSNDGRVYALDAQTGDPLWTFETGDAVRSSPAVVDGTVYVIS